MILRELRERKRISQQALGELFEVSAQTINNWECGKAEPDFEALMGLALFFGVSVDTLIGFDVKGNASTLRSCPFCGGRARIITGVSTSGSLKPSAHIKCEDCLAETAWAEDVNSDGTFIDEAKRRWNMRIHKIGEKHNGYKIFGNINNKVALAHNQNSVEPWVVWWIDKQGVPYGGSYFADRESALNEFMSRGFSGGVYAEC
ncbi:Restriction alleviation protein Lar [Ruminococcaceae bacterium P7]|nr:Restriction alleviation protein Lar [Ruminococcaceae bacterium P7]